MMTTHLPASTAPTTRLLNEYKRILSDFFSLLTLGAPESLLPASKEAITQAIRATAMTHVLDQSDLTDMDTLRSAYTALATFLPDDEAYAAAQLHAASGRGDMKFMASPAAEQVMARVQRIEQEAAVLGREFDEWIRTQGPLGLLSDVNALFGEFDTKYFA